MDASADPAAQSRPSLELRLPADPSFMATARVFAASVGRTLGMDDERVQDLKLVVSELCASSSERGASDAAVDLAVDWDDAEVRFVCRGAGRLVAPGADEDPTPYRWRLIEALTERSNVLSHPDGSTTVRFSLDR
jgi:hypothetical protein